MDGLFMTETLQRILFSTFLIFSACTHQSGNQSSRQCASAACATSVEKAGQLTIQDAKNLVDEVRWQEGAWLLRHIGEQKMADALEDQIAVNYEKMKIKSFEKMETTTVSEVYLVTLTNGQKGIFKPHPRHWKEKSLVNAALANPDAEVMSYLFARELQLTLVPVTVKRVIEGMEGSLQAFVELKDLNYTYNEMQIPDLRKEVFRQVYNPMDLQARLIGLLDYLIMNMDRMGNKNLRWVMKPKLDPRAKPGQGSGLVAYDNGASFQNQNQAKGKFRPENPQSINVLGSTFVDPKKIDNFHPFFEALKTRLNEKRIRQLMTGVFDEVVIKQTLERRQILLDFYKNLVPRNH